MPTSKALILLFDKFNTLDVNGPLEVLRKSGQSDIIDVKIASEDPITESIEGCRIQRHLPIDQALIDNIEKFDLLVVPGAPGPAISAQLSKLNHPFFKVISAFAALDASSSPIPRILLSICTGALFVGTLGLFNDTKFCTSHWGVYSQLQAANIKAAGGNEEEAAKVLPARFVDAGLNKSEVRIISSGGISCGMDASLHVVKIRAEELKGTGTGEQYARETAEMLDYAWRKTEGVVMDEDYA